MFDIPRDVVCVVQATLPDGLRIRNRASTWLSQRGRDATSFLEGPAFDRSGNLYCVDTAYGRVLRLASTGQWSVVVSYDGQPNGIAIHRDGRLFIADRRCGIVVLEPGTAAVHSVLSRVGTTPLHGPNDLTFALDGTLYFTDQGASDLRDPSGRVIRITVDGAVEVLVDNVPGPNGLALSPDERILYVAVTRANAIWRIHDPQHARGGRVDTFVHLSGGTGPDGLAVDESGGVAVAHPGLGCAWIFSPAGEALYRVRSPHETRLTTNLAYGGVDRRMLVIVESATGSILSARLPQPGIRLFSHL